MSLEAKWHWLAEQISRAGPRTRFWLRDDDAVAPTPALDHLLHVTERHHVPVALAIIPALAGQALVTRLEESRMACPVVHGWAHCNHAPDGSKKQELGLHRPLAVVLEELAGARQRMSREPINAVWQESMKGFFVDAAGRRADEQMRPLEEVFHLA